MMKMETELGVLFVAAAGNSGKAVNSYPQLAQQHLSGMIVVGSTDIEGYRASTSSDGPAVSVWAPGKDLLVPQPNILTSEAIYKTGKARGTSFGAYLSSFLCCNHNLSLTWGFPTPSQPPGGRPRCLPACPPPNLQQESGQHQEDNLGLVAEG